MVKVKNVDEYIDHFPVAVQHLLRQIRLTVKKVAPDAEEVISYGMPTFKQQGVLVHFGAFASHIGFYATPSAHAAFAEKLAGYKQGKGSVQFPFDEPLPLEIIESMVVFKLKENLRKKSNSKS